MFWFACVSRFVGLFPPPPLKKNIKQKFEIFLLDPLKKEEKRALSVYFCPFWYWCYYSHRLRDSAPPLA